MRLQLLTRSLCSVPFPRKKLLLILISLTLLTLTTLTFRRRTQNDVRHLKSKNDRQTEYIDSKGMHVVVGRYVGSDLSSNKPDLSESEIDANRYDPRPGDGEDGQPVFLGLREDRVGKRLWHINKFNILGM